MTVSFWQRADLGPEVSCDVAVVGGGIIGASTAYWLKQQHPERDIVLLEAETLGYGASGRNAGFLLQGAAVDYATDVQRYGVERAEKLWDFTLENRQLIAAICTEEHIGFTGSGSVLLAGDAGEAERLLASAERLNARHQPVAYWNAERVEQEVRGRSFRGGLFIPSGATVDSLRLVREIAGLSGARLLEHHPVYELHPTGERIALLSPRRRVLATSVILTLNAYLPRLLPETSAFVRPVRAQMCATKAIDAGLPYPIYSHEGYYYLLQLPSGELLVGGARHLHEKDEVGYADCTTDALQADLLAYLKRHFPHLKPPDLTESIDHRWSGTMGFTPDGLPAIGYAGGLPQCLWAAGFNGHGMGYGFRFGQLLASIHDATHPNDFYTRMFSVSRFGDDASLP
jgi:glycine/D-amino acid oxidase-like deaminating enzyme